MAAEDDVASQALWRAGRARLLVRTGEPQQAMALAAEAVRLLEDTDALVTRAEALTDQAEVLDAGRRDRARRERRRGSARDARAQGQPRRRRGGAGGLRRHLSACSRCGSGPGRR